VREIQPAGIDVSKLEAFLPAANDPGHVQTPEDEYWKDTHA
jgi:hypothetical protein